MVSVNDLTVCIHGGTVLSDISCTLPSGRITSFIGPSGAGKTTLLKSIAGLIDYKQGYISVDGKKVAGLSSVQRSEHIGYVFQDFNLFPHMTVLNNCMSPQVMHTVAPDSASQQALKFLTLLGMEAYAEKYPSELSGGQKQRVAIARALCLNPKILLLDEPTASLDPANTDLLVSILQELAQQGFIIGVSTQDMSFIHKIFDRVYYLEQGCIKEFCDGKDALQSSVRIKKFLK